MSRMSLACHVEYATKKTLYPRISAVPKSTNFNKLACHKMRLRFTMPHFYNVSIERVTVAMYRLSGTSSMSEESECRRGLCWGISSSVGAECLLEL